MKKIISGVFLTLITASLLFSQKPMVAYRKEGIWHFFDTKGKLMWKPYLDVAGQPANWVNGLLRASVMDFNPSASGGVNPVREQVLYNNKGQIVFRPKVKFRCRIVSGIDAAGFVEVMAFDESRICLFDKAGNLLFRAPNMNGKYLGDGVVAYDARTSLPESSEMSIEYTLKDIKTGKELGKVTCSSFDGNLSNGFVDCYSEDFKISVINRTGKIILPMGYDKRDFDEMAIIAKDMAAKGMFVARKDDEELWTIFDKNGKVLLKDLFSVTEYEHPFVKIYRSDDSGSFQWYDLSKAQPSYVEVMDGILEKPTPKGNFMCFELGEDSIKLYDRSSKVLKKLYAPSWDIKVMGEHFWVKTYKSETVHQCYNAQGNIVGSIAFNNVGKPKYGVIPFELDGLWGLATETGKVLVKPTYKTENGESIEVSDGFFLISTFTTDGLSTFAFYDFNGKLIMSTTPEADGWDYILPAMTEGKYYSDNF